MRFSLDRSFFLVPLLYSHFRSRGDHQFSPMLSPRSCLVRDFPQLVASEFQDISFLYIVLAIKITSSRPWLLPQSSLTSNLTLSNPIHSSQCVQLACLPAPIPSPLITPVVRLSSPFFIADRLAHRPWFPGASSKRSSWGRSRRTFMACTECRRRQVKVRVLLPIMMPQPRSHR